MRRIDHVCSGREGDYAIGTGRSENGKRACRRGAWRGSKRRRGQFRRNRFGLSLTLGRSGAATSASRGRCGPGQLRRQCGDPFLRPQGTGGRIGNEASDRVELAAQIAIHHDLAQRAFVGNAEQSAYGVHSRLVPPVERLVGILQARQDYRWQSIHFVERGDRQRGIIGAQYPQRRREQDSETLLLLVGHWAPVPKRFCPAAYVEIGVRDVNQQIGWRQVERARDPLDFVRPREDFAAFDLGQANIGNVGQSLAQGHQLLHAAKPALLADAVGKHESPIGIRNDLRSSRYARYEPGRIGKRSHALHGSFVILGRRRSRHTEAYRMD